MHSLMAISDIFIPHLRLRAPLAMSHCRRSHSYREPFTTECSRSRSGCTASSGVRVRCREVKARGDKAYRRASSGRDMEQGTAVRGVDRGPLSSSDHLCAEKLSKAMVPTGCG